MFLTFNQQSGLMVACGKGFLEIVHGLHNCPYIDVNHQDNEGNTALMIASQAGKFDPLIISLFAKQLGCWVKSKFDASDV